MATETNPKLEHTSRSQEETDLPAFDIGLDEVVSSSTNVHTTNDPRDPWQRPTVTESNNGRVAVSCVCKDVIHGFYAQVERGVQKEGEEEDEDSDDELSQQACTLIVLHFRFDPVDLGRRIKKVQAMMRFSAMHPTEEDDPIVDRVSPGGFYFVYPTTQKETVTAGVLGKVTAPLPGVEVGGELKRDRTVEREVTNGGSVRGAIETIGRSWGKPNAATWTLMENETDRTGTPVSLRASILVRHSGVDFQAHFTMTITPDNMTKAQTWFKSKVKDDPILFKVDKKPTNKLHKYTVEAIDEAGEHKLINNLGKLDLDSPEFADITFRIVWKTAQK